MTAEKEVAVSETERIVDQLRRASDGGAWHGPSLAELLEDVDARMAAARPVEDAHTIWELVLHITTWRDVARRRLEGEVVEPPDQVDWPPVPEASEESWGQALASLEAAARRLQEALASLDEADLDDRASGCDYTNYILAHGVVQHDLYHAGQIALLKKA